MKKLLVLILAVMMTASMFIASAEELVVGTDATFEPFEYIGDDASIQGFDIELIGAILDLAQLEYKVESTNFEALIPALNAGQFNIIIAALTISEERGKSVLFSEPYFSAAQKLIVLADSNIKVEADILVGMKVGVQLGTTGDIYVSDNLEGVVCERYSKALDAILDLKNGRLDAVMVDSAPADVFANAVEGIKVLEENLSDEQYGIAVQLGNTDLLQIINDGLKTLQDNGGFKEIYEKYFDIIE